MHGSVLLPLLRLQLIVLLLFRFAGEIKSYGVGSARSRYGDDFIGALFRPMPHGGLQILGLKFELSYGTCSTFHIAIEVVFASYLATLCADCQMFLRIFDVDTRALLFQACFSSDATIIQYGISASGRWYDGSQSICLPSRQV